MWNVDAGEENEASAAMEGLAMAMASAHRPIPKPPIAGHPAPVPMFPLRSKYVCNVCSISVQTSNVQGLRNGKTFALKKNCFNCELKAK